MPPIDREGEDEIANGMAVQHSGTAILPPPAMLQNLVKKSNEFIVEHRQWLRGFSRPESDPTSMPTPSTTTSPISTNPSYALTTPPPSLDLRNAFPEPQILNCVSQFCDCTPQVSAATVSLGFVASASMASFSSSLALQLANASSQAAAASAGQAAASSSLASANVQIAQFTSSIAGLFGGSAAAASSASLAIAAAQWSANALVDAANASVTSANAAAAIAQNNAVSASSLVAIAEASAGSAIVAAAVAQASASQILSVANSIASDAKATATLALAQALSTISSVKVQASAAIVGAQLQATPATKFALIITFAILGSSLVSILAFFLLQRYRNASKIAKEHEYRDCYPEEYYLKDVSVRSRSRRSSATIFSRSESRPRSDPKPRRNTARQSEKDWDDRVYEYPGIDIPLPNQGEEKGVVSTFPAFTASPKEDLPALKNSIIYDPSEPDKPPRFRSWLTETVSSVSPFGDFRNSKKINAQKKKEKEDEIRRIAIKKAREGEERKEAERKKRESDERRLRARVENEEVERKVSLRRPGQEG